MLQAEEFAPLKSETNSYLLRFLLVLGTAALLAAVLVYPFPWSGRQSSEIFNLAHAPSFLAVLLLVAGLLDPSSIGLPKSWHRILPLNRSRLIVVGILLLLVGGLCEFIQGYVGRSPSVSDVLANASGLSAGVSWCLSRKRIDQAGRVGLKLTSAVLLIAPSWSPIFELHECSLQQKEFPLLASFERERELGIWYAHEAMIKRSTDWATLGSASLQIHGSAGAKYSGANLLEPVSDWHEFSMLKFDVLNPGDTPLTLTVVIHDTLHVSSGYDRNDRFSRTVELPPGKHITVDVPLADVQAAPATRLMDLSQIASLNLYVAHPQADFVLNIDNVCLANQDH
ncbi:MAG: hypothetical protein KDB01_16935 [Planctomycetaceae bacterium]|nr:hypothetical protein [Planctomycetaceae bacterium]